MKQKPTKGTKGKSITDHVRDAVARNLTAPDVVPYVRQFVPESVIRRAGKKRILRIYAGLKEINAERLSPVHNEERGA